MIHRIPLWLLGPLMITSAVAVTSETTAMRAGLAIAGAVLSALITFPFLRRHWRELTGRSCPVCRRSFVPGEAVYREVISGRSMFHQRCLPAGLAQPTWKPAVHGTPWPPPQSAAAAAPSAPRAASSNIKTAPLVSPQDCVSHRAGHRPHPTQVRLAYGTPGQRVRVEALGRGWLDLIYESSGETEKVWCHDEARIGEFLAEYQHRGRLRSNGVLTGPDGSGLVLSVAKQPSPCVPSSTLQREPVG